jgi:hypothetical protein
MYAPPPHPETPHRLHNIPTYWPPCQFFVSCLVAFLTPSSSYPRLTTISTAWSKMRGVSESILHYDSTFLLTKLSLFPRKSTISKRIQLIPFQTTLPSSMGPNFQYYPNVIDIFTYSSYRWPYSTSMNFPSILILRMIRSYRASQEYFWV